MEKHSRAFRHNSLWGRSKFEPGIEPKNSLEQGLIIFQFDLLHFKALLGA